MKLREEITKEISHHNNGTDAKVIAESLLKRLRKADLLVMLAEEVAHHQRYLSRQQERAAFEGMGDEDVPDFTGPEKNSGLLATRFALGDGGQVTWGKATIDDHRQRLEVLRKIRDGLNESIRYHEWAITLLESTGATCLEEIGATEPVAA